MIPQIPDHLNRALTRLREQYKGKPRFAALIEALVNEIQQLEDAVATMNQENLDNAVGAQLDGYGIIVGLPRVPGQSDEDYRMAIKLRIGQNVSEGEPEIVIQAFQSMVGASLVYLCDGENAEIILMSDVDLTQDQVNTLIPTMKRVIAAGVRLSHIGSFDPVEPFAFAGGLAGLGFGSESNPAPGGKFATVSSSNRSKFAFAGPNPVDSGFGTLYDPLVGGVFIGV